VNIPTQQSLDCEKNQSRNRKVAKSAQPTGNGKNVVWQDSGAEHRTRDLPVAALKAPAFIKSTVNGYKISIPSLANKIPVHLSAVKDGGTL
jgi:hypothetical protein